MLKWMFVRMEEPHASPGPSWHYTDPAWPPEDALQARGTIINPDAYCPAVAEANWDWLRGCWQSGRTQRPHTAAAHCSNASDDQGICPLPGRSRCGGCRPAASSAGAPVGG